MRRVAAVVAVLTVVACDDQSMRLQKRYETEAPSPLWPDGTSARPLPEGVIARGAVAHREALAHAPSVTPELIARGRERYGIYCSPCHGLSGHGDGMIVARGFPAPPSYHSARLRAAAPEHLVDVITNGYGVMYPYAARVAPRDRWAITAYIRALQLSQAARVADDPDLREKLP